tara:strand:+ start:1231 stop:1473 length:243 start_codon:yes stop_codon:yes gene_type:complete
MELIDTPNPNAKKILVDHSYEIAKYINNESEGGGGIAQLLIEIKGIDSVFTGPGFLTITRDENTDWDTINNDILNKFDTM